jgi:hypothetical protein
MYRNNQRDGAVDTAGDSDALNALNENLYAVIDSVRVQNASVSADGASADSASGDSASADSASADNASADSASVSADSASTDSASSASASAAVINDIVITSAHTAGANDAIIDDNAANDVSPILASTEDMNVLESTTDTEDTNVLTTGADVNNSAVEISDNDALDDCPPLIMNSVTVEDASTAEMDVSSPSDEVYSSYKATTEIKETSENTDDIE